MITVSIVRRHAYSVDVVKILKFEDNEMEVAERWARDVTTHISFATGTKYEAIIKKDGE